MMKEILTFLNDYVSNLDPKSVFFGILACYLCEILFIPIFHISDIVLDRKFKEWSDKDVSGKSDETSN